MLIDLDVVLIVLLLPAGVIGWFLFLRRVWKDAIALRNRRRLERQKDRWLAERQMKHDRRMARKNKGSKR